LLFNLFWSYTLIIIDKNMVTATKTDIQIKIFTKDPADGKVITLLSPYAVPMVAAAVVAAVLMDI
jgi:hypothetical protein